MLKVSTKSARRSRSPRCKTASIQTRRKAVENPFPARAGMNRGLAAARLDGVAVPRTRGDE